MRTYSSKTYNWLDNDNQGNINMKSLDCIDEIINEIGTQTLARFGLNIFNLNTYAAYGSTVNSTNDLFRTHNLWKNNDNASRGQSFEDIDSGHRNIKSALHNSGEKTYTTDQLYDIKNTANILSSEKNLNNLNTKDREKVEFTLRQFPDEVTNILQNPEMLLFAKKNHSTTDTVTFDKKGTVIDRAQLKVIKNTKDLFEREKMYSDSGKILKGENGEIIYKRDSNGNYVYKYLENNDSLRMPLDDYKKHRHNLEIMLENDKLTPHERENINKALTILNQSNFANRIMCENPRTTAVITQSTVGIVHTVQAGFSDAVVVLLSTIANGAIYEIKDSFNNPDTPIIVRIKRLFNTMLSKFKETFYRGASFGSVDVVIDVLSQIFKSISSKLRLIWKTWRNSLKSIYNAVWDFISGKITSYREVISIIVKGLFSAVVVVGIITLETKLEALLSPILTPIVAAFIAPALSIIVGSLAVITMSKTVDLALNALFGVFAERDTAKLKMEEMTQIIESTLPKLIEDRDGLEKLFKTDRSLRLMQIEDSFKHFSAGFSDTKIDFFLQGLVKINNVYGQELQFSTFKEFDDFMLDKNSVFKL